jgi:hypothetical protein
MTGLKILDWLLTILHFLIIIFNLFGWVWKPLRKLHWLSVLIIAVCWFILGLWFGIGYCPLTDWQWQIKEKLGERHLPDSFIEYYAVKISGRQVNSRLVDSLTALCFTIASLLSIYDNLLNRNFLRCKD